MMDHSLQQTINIIRYAENGGVDRMEAKRWLTFTKKNVVELNLSQKLHPDIIYSKPLKLHVD